jgi:glutamine synthetase
MTTSPESVIQEMEASGVEHVRLGAVDMDGVLRGKYISLKKFKSALHTGLGFCDVIFGWDSADELYDDAKYTGWHTGYPDALARIEIETQRTVPWEDGIPFFLMDFYTEDGSALPVSPRQALRRVTDLAAGQGFVPMFAAEYEFFLFRETPHTLHEKDFRNLTPLSPGMFGYSALRASAVSDFLRATLSALNAFNVPLEGFHTETGPGVFEAAIGYDRVVDAADKAALFKTGFKELCGREEISACFMAKFDASLPGSSGHTHQSLWDLDAKTNLFHDASGEDGMSDTFRWYLGGLARYLPELTALFCPTVNSYKRLVPGMWAPTHVTWGIDNRTAALRVIRGTSGKEVRVENRLAGADANPYLAFAASLAAGLEGIAQKIDPPPRIVGNGYEGVPDGLALPRDLFEAADRLAQSEMARRWLGETFVEHYVISRRWEAREYNKAVTDWERRRYFEII